MLRQSDTGYRYRRENVTPVTVTVDVPELSTMMEAYSSPHSFAERA